MTQVGDAQHKRRPSVEWSDYNRFAKQNARGRPGKAHEDETGHDREPEHPGDDFQSCNDVAVKSLRIHVAIANGGQRLHTEKERLDE